MTTSEEVVLEVDGLRMRYGTTDVLHDVTFQSRIWVPTTPAMPPS